MSIAASAGERGAERTTDERSREEAVTEYVLTLSCPDVAGIVHAVAGFLAARGCNIEQSQQYGDPQSRRFFMRVQFAPLEATDVDFATEFEPVAARFDMSWRLVDAHHRARTLVMVSREGHCLNDLMYRQEIGGLPAEIVCVVSNHTDLQRMAQRGGVAFRHVPITADTRPDAERRLVGLIEEFDVELVVLARYMQILSDDLCRRLAGRCINIHHSMLPSFRGSRPYAQAHQRGVKLIGATAHYVTAELDEGPIIEQEVARVDHSMVPEEVAALGRDVESLALARAVTWHAQNRVLLNGNRTVVLR